MSNVLAIRVDKFKDARNKRFDGEAYFTYDKNALANCRQLCISEYRYLYSID